MGKKNKHRDDNDSETSIVPIMDDDYEEDDTAEEEWESQDKFRTLFVALLLLTGLCIATKVFNDALYTQSARVHSTRMFQEFFFKGSMAISGALFVVVCLSICDCIGNETGLVALSAFSYWTGFICFMNFGFMACSFPWTCAFYDSRGFRVTENAFQSTNWNPGPVQGWNFQTLSGTSEVELMKFTHIECPKFFNGAAPARVIAVFLGHVYAAAALVVLGSLKYIAESSAQLKGSDVPKSLGPVLASIMVDFVDLQDFCLLLIDDEVLKTFWSSADGGYGGCWLWYVVVIMTVLAFIGMSGEAVYQFVFVVRDDDEPREPTGNTRFLQIPTEPWQPGDNVGNIVSLCFIEFPFLVMRVYCAVRFDIPPSSLILKNIYSICKESWELWNQKHISLTHMQATIQA